MLANGFENLVEGQIHLPFGILLQVARNAAKQVGADLGHLGPGGLASVEFRSLTGSAGITAVINSKKNTATFFALMLGRPHSLSKTGTVERKSLPGHEIIDPYDYGIATRRLLPPTTSRSGVWVRRRLRHKVQSVERRNSGALSDFAGSDLVSDLTGSDLCAGRSGLS